MTRSQKLRKLALAVKAYKGAYNAVVVGDQAAVRWIRSPQHDKRMAIVRWLTALGRTHDQIDRDARAIDGLKNHEQFFAWLAKVEKGQD